MLVVMSGLPGVGKSAVADGIGRALEAPVLSVDPIEAAMRQAGVARDQPAGLAAYVVADVLARHIIELGQTVVIDAVNPVEAAREQWRAIARQCDVPIHVIEVVCSDEALYRERVEARVRDMPGFPELTWANVLRARDTYEPWTDARLVIDSIGDLTANVARALAYLRGSAPVRR